MKIITKFEHKLTSSPILCAHCGNKAPMFIVCEGKHIDDLGEDVGGESIVSYWQVLICSSCEKVNVLESWESTVEEMPDGHGGSFSPRHTQVLFPATRRTFTHLPPLVARSYETAIKILPIEPIGFVVFAARTLEFLCQDRNAVGKDLNDKLKNLVERSEIPPILAEMAHSIRLFRNQGAHAAQIEVADVTRDDAEDVRNLCETILEYVYEARPMLEKARARLDELKHAGALPIT